MVQKKRYSDADLLKFEIIIKSALEKAEKDRDELLASLSLSSGNGTDDTAAKIVTIEDASDSQQKEISQRLISGKNKFINSLNIALGNIGNKTYGICSVTDQLIPRERLLAEPHTTKCIEAKKN